MRCRALLPLWTRADFSGTAQPFPRRIAVRAEACASLGPPCP